MHKLVAFILLLVIPSVIYAQSEETFVIVAHAFWDKNKAISMSKHYKKKKLNSEVVEVGESGIFRVCINSYPDHFSAEISRDALINKQTIPIDAWILSNITVVEMPPDETVTNAPIEKKQISTPHRTIIYKGNLYKIPKVKSINRTN